MGSLDGWGVEEGEEGEVVPLFEADVGLPVVFSTGVVNGAGGIWVAYERVRNG